MAQTAGKPTLTAMFGHGPFRTLWIAQFVSVFGDFLALFGVISRITFRLHGSASDVGFVVAAYIAPVAVVAPFAGVLVDRWNVKRVMIASDVIRACLAVTLVFSHSVPQIALALAALGFVSSFFAPAQSVTLRTLVQPSELLSANAMFAQAFYVVRILSPAVAGAVVASLGENACFWFDAFSFAFSAAMLGTLRISRPPAAASDRSWRTLGRDFAEGNRFIFSHRGLTFVCVSSALAMFTLSSFSPLISVYIRDTLHAGALLYGGISAMVGVGLIGGTHLVRSAGARRPMENIVVAGLFGIGAAAGLLGALRSSAAAALSTLTLGAAIAFVMVPAQTLSQKETPPAMQGRVSSTFMALFSGAQVLGMLASASLADWLGIRALFLVCAATVALLAVSGWLLFGQRSAVGLAP